jgi:hypothetical protein
MTRKKTIFLVVSLCILMLLVVGLISFFVGYQSGYSWGRRAEQRSALRLPDTVDIYGCGVDRFVRIGGGSPLPIHVFLSWLQPLPPAANAAFIDTTNGNHYCRLAELLRTNGMGRLPLVGGERVLLAHATQ